MEGKGLLFKIYADIDVFDIELDANNVEDFIRPLRHEDNGNTVWKTFNVIQEKFVRGGLKYQSEKGRVTSMKQLKDFQAVNKINTNLWELAESYC
jgi:malic enzyme